MTGSVGAAYEYRVIILVYVKTETLNCSFKVLNEHHDDDLS
jgi:hypothetical protein